jgi:hypothetical protein
VHGPGGFGAGGGDQLVEVAVDGGVGDAELGGDLGDGVAGDRPSRSSLVTTIWSPARATSRALSSSGRRASFPEALSVKIFSQPAARSASIWLSGF